VDYCRIFNLSGLSDMAIGCNIFNRRVDWEIWPEEEKRCKEPKKTEK